MSDQTEALESVLWQALSADDDLRALATSGIWWDQGPESADYPIVILAMDAPSDEDNGRTMAKGQRFVDYSYTVTCYADGDNARARALQMTSLVYDLLDGYEGAGSVDLQDCRRVSILNPLSMMDAGTFVVAVASRYAVRVRT